MLFVGDCRLSVVGCALLVVCSVLCVVCWVCVVCRLLLPAAACYVVSVLSDVYC